MFVKQSTVEIWIPDTQLMETSEYQTLQVFFHCPNLFKNQSYVQMPFEYWSGFQTFYIGYGHFKNPDHLTIEWLFTNQKLLAKPKSFFIWVRVRAVLRLIFIWYQNKNCYWFIWLTQFKKTMRGKVKWNIKDDWINFSVI